MMLYKELLGRKFLPSVQDCFSLVRDFYALNFQMELKNYARPSDWNSNDIDLIGLCYENEGFEKVNDWALDKLYPGDLLCMAIGSNVANHLAVYVGENKIVHHITNRFSNDELLRPFWRKSICYVLRHPEVPKIEQVKPKTDLMEILYARRQVNSVEIV
jgi:cell wall-associated NlpC family hydrolase